MSNLSIPLMEPRAFRARPLSFSRTVDEVTLSPHVVRYLLNGHAGLVNQHLPGLVRVFDRELPDDNIHLKDFCETLDVLKDLNPPSEFVTIFTVTSAMLMERHATSFTFFQYGQIARELLDLSQGRLEIPEDRRLSEANKKLDAISDTLLEMNSKDSAYVQLYALLVSRLLQEPLNSIQAFNRSSKEISKNKISPMLMIETANDVLYGASDQCDVEAKNQLTQAYINLLGKLKDKHKNYLVASLSPSAKLNIMQLSLFSDDNIDISIEHRIKFYNTVNSFIDEDLPINTLCETLPHWIRHKNLNGLKREGIDELQSKMRIGNLEGEINFLIDSVKELEERKISKEFKEKVIKRTFVETCWLIGKGLILGLLRGF